MRRLFLGRRVEGGWWILDIRYQILDTGYWMLDIGHCECGARSRILDFRISKFDFRV